LGRIRAKDRGALSRDGRVAVLRILHLGKFYPPVRGGIETHLQTLSRQLMKRAAIEVIVSSESGERRDEVIDGVTVHRLPRWLTIAGTPICPTIVSQLRHTRSDLLHLHAPNPLAMFAVLVSGHPAPLIITWHSDIVRQRVLGHCFRIVEQMVLRRASAVIATSPEYLASSLPLAAHSERCHVVPLGIYPEEFCLDNFKRVAELRRRYGERIVLSVGRLIYYKGFEYLIRAMRGLAAHLLIIGEGPLRGRLERLARQLGVADRVSLLGNQPREEVIAFYHAADVFVLPSIARSEAFGIVQLEAMSCGKPVVNTRLPSGVPFVSRDGETGITVEPRSAEALAAAVSKLLEDRDVARRYGAAGLRRVRDHFGADMMASRVIELYEAVLRAVPRSTAQVAH
jgi:glycosyltransferase involved in cell wall biosynthesis